MNNVKIRVNDKEHIISTCNPHPMLSYGSIKELAGYRLYERPACTFHNGDHSGTLSGFEMVEIVDGMTFQVNEA